MGIFDSKSKSRTETTTQNAGFSEIAGPATSLNVKGGGTTTVNALDGGAVAASFDFAKGAQTEALRQVEIAGANVSALTRESIAAVSENAKSETENITLTAIKWGVVAVIAWAAFSTFKRG